MKFQSAILFCLASTIVASPPQWHELTPSYTYEAYCDDFGKDIAARRADHEVLFYKELATVLYHNGDDSNSYKMGINQFSDMTSEEMKAFKGLSRSTLFGSREIESDMKETNVQIPDSIDWRDYGVVTPVKNQMRCGSCWAFAATEVLESHIAVSTGKLFEFAPQQWVSCSYNPNQCGGTGGCEGSIAEIAFQAAVKQGMTLETSYPYQAVTGICQPNKIKPVANISGHVLLPRNSYNKVLTALATVGPLAINVDAETSWKSYAGGIFPASRGGTNIDHVVQLVGYGTDATTGMDYWLVRNSWSTSWGENGYIRLERNGGTTCGIDVNNQAGVGCQDDPTQVKVCGTSGLLYDVSYPTGGRLI